MRRELLVLFAIATGSAAWIASGCGGDESASESDDVGWLGDGDLALTPPAPPVLTPCPDGWAESAGEGPDAVVVCEPWPGGSDERCEGATAHFLGESGCRAVGPACPEGDWADALPDEAGIVFVRAGAGGGDGTRAAPLGTIAEGLAQAPPGGVVAVAKGTYDEALVVEADVTLWGACTAETLIAPPADGEGEFAVRATGAELALRNLQLSGSRPGLMAEQGASLELEDVLVAGPMQVGVGVQADSALVADGLVVRGLRYEGEATGAALAVGGRSRVEARDSVFIDIEGNGVLAAPGSDVSLSRVAIRDTHLGGAHVERGGLGGGMGDDEAVPGIGIMALDALLTISESLVECSQLGAGVIIGSDAHAELSHGVIRGNASWVSCPAFPPGPSISSGIAAQEGAQLTLDRMLVDGTRWAAVAVVDTRGAVLRDVLIRATLTPPPDALGMSNQEPSIGLMLFSEASAQVERLRVEGTAGVAIFVLESFVLKSRRGSAWASHAQMLETEANLRGTDVVIEGTQQRACDPGPCEDPGMSYGVGLLSAEDAVVELSRFEVHDNVLCGIQLAGGTMTLEEGLVARNEIGVNIQVPGVDVDELAQRVVFRDNGRNLDSQHLPVPRVSALQSDEPIAEPDAGGPRDAGTGPEAGTHVDAGDLATPPDAIPVNPDSSDVWQDEVEVEGRLTDAHERCVTICETYADECADPDLECAGLCGQAIRSLRAAIDGLVIFEQTLRCLDAYDALVTCTSGLGCDDYSAYVDASGEDYPCAEEAATVEATCWP